MVNYKDQLVGLMVSAERMRDLPGLGSVPPTSRTCSYEYVICSDLLRQHGLERNIEYFDFYIIISRSIGHVFVKV